MTRIYDTTLGSRDIATVVGIGDSRSWMFWQVSLDINNYDMDSMLLFEVTKVTELESIHVKTKMQLQGVSSHICELHYP